MTVHHKRKLVDAAVAKHGMSQRRACRVLGQNRSSHRHRPALAAKDEGLRFRLRTYAAENPRYGYRRAAETLRREGYRLNDKRVHRLWRQLGLQVPQRRRRWRLVGNASNGCHRRRATRKNEIWAYDFISDQTTDGRSLKLLTIVDEYTRQSLLVHPARSIRSDVVIDELARLIAARGAPAAVRSDNGPEFVAEAVRKFLADHGAQTLLIEPGAPWQNGYAESFNSRLRDEVLDRELFGSVAEARVVLEAYRHRYNHERLHSSLGYLTPNEFAELDNESSSVPPLSPPNTPECHSCWT